MASRVSTKQNGTSALEFFWERADEEALGDHPLMVELCHRLDAVDRYTRMITDAEAGGHDELVSDLVRENERQERVIGRLRTALQRMTGGSELMH